MKLRKIAALFLAGALSVSMCAVPVLAEEEEYEEEADEDEEDDEAEIKVALMVLSTLDEDNCQHVEDAINEITEEEIGVTVDLMWMDAPTYMQQVPQMLQASETLDLLMFTPIPVTGYQSYMNQKQLVDITDLLDEYGPAIKETLGDYLKATTKDSKIYGVGNLGDLSGRAALDIRRDLLQNAGVEEKAEAATNWQDVEEVFAALKEEGSVPNVVINADAEGSTLAAQPYVFGDGDFADAEWLDVIGDGYQYVYADPADNTVKCYFDNEKWIETCKVIRDFYEKGYIYKDAATAQDYGGTQIKNGVGSVMVHAVELGNEANMEAQTGYPDCEVDIVNAKVSTASFTKFGFGVPVTAEEPEAAIKFLNLLYENSDLLDTLTWGVEGVDWVKTEDGMADYPEGVTAETVQYHTADFLYANRLAITPWVGTDTNIREIQAEENAAMEVSPFFGFNIDSEPVASTVAAVKAVVDQYKPGLCSGIYEDVDATIAEFHDALYAAGMQELLDTYQTQLDEWLAQQ